MAKDAASEKPAEGASAPAAKSNMMLIIIIAVLTTLLIGGGITTFMLMRSSGHDAEESAATEEEHAEGEKPASKKTDSKKKSSKDKDAVKVPAIYIPLEPPFVVNFEATQSARFLQVNIELMTRDAATAALLKENNPLVRNDLLLLFGNQEYSVVGAREGKEMLRKQALDTVRSIVKAEGGDPELLEAVYFTSFVMQ